MSTGVEKKYDIMTSGTSCEGEDAITCSYDMMTNKLLLSVSVHITLYG